MILPQSRIFQPIPRSHERDSILSDAAAGVVDVFVKFSEKQTLLAKALKWLPPFKLQITYPEGLRPLIQKAIPVHFNSRGEKYFAQVFTQDTGTHFFLVIEGPLYKVQRRQSFRLKLPTDYPMKVDLFEMNGHRMNEKARLLDLSEGGCSLSVPLSLASSMGAFIGLNIKIGARPAFVQYGHVRYLKADKSQVRFGVKFDQNSELNSDLFNLTRDLYVELFSKWARRR
jgi:PilZ domain